jgi:hypothetical protein
VYSWIPGSTLGEVNGMAAELETQVPYFVESLRAVLQADFDDDLQAERVTIQALASGEVVWRAHPAGGGDYIGGVVFVGF